jgi:hypothetical protein
MALLPLGFLPKVELLDSMSCFAKTSVGKIKQPSLSSCFTKIINLSIPSLISYGLIGHPLSLCQRVTNCPVFVGVVFATLKIADLLLIISFKAPYSLDSFSIITLENSILFFSRRLKKNVISLAKSPSKV